MSPLISPIYVHSNAENQWYHLRTSRFENQIEFLTKKRPWVSSIFAKSAALVGVLSGIGMIVGGALKLSSDKRDASDPDSRIQILSIAGAGVVMISAIWAIYQRCYCNHLRASRLALNRELDTFFSHCKGTVNFNQFFTKVDNPNPNSKFRFEVDVDGEIRQSLNEGGCCLVEFNQR